jgi:hypothetical protein
MRTQPGLEPYTRAALSPNDADTEMLPMRPHEFIGAPSGQVLGIAMLRLSLATKPSPVALATKRSRAREPA